MANSEQFWHIPARVRPSLGDPIDVSKPKNECARKNTGTLMSAYRSNLYRGHAPFPYPYTRMEQL